MIILLYGPDDYRRERKKIEIITEFEKKHSSLGVRILNAAEKESAADLEFFLRNQSIFDSKKIVVIENLFPLRGAGGADDEDDGVASVVPSDSEESSQSNVGKKTITDILKEYSVAPSVTILISEKKKPAKSFAFLLKKSELIQEFEGLAGPGWDAFVKSEAKKNGITLSVSSAKFLGEVYQGNSWALATELQKLSGFKKEIDLDDLNEFDLDVAPNYWALVNGAKSYDLRSRLSALEKLFSMNDPAPKIFNILSASWREKTPQFAAYDKAIKSGKLEYEEALVDLVIG